MIIALILLTFVSCFVITYCVFNWVLFKPQKISVAKSCVCKFERKQ
jgi:beta-lactam-binding protein with PASTA domain